MGRRPATVVGILAAMLAGTNCAEEGRDALGTAAARESAGDWHLFNIADVNGDGLGDALWFSPSANLFAVWLIDRARERER